MVVFFTIIRMIEFNILLNLTDATEHGQLQILCYSWPITREHALTLNRPIYATRHGPKTAER